ncbi:beta-hexosaminidase subunit alpha isoform X1 [Esox lucius]|uniref:Beta-hexosaminidase n=1 Tax=Esox lucius TaxID=8010 RepID=A0A3P8XAW8_ESOLU|nr:beta-hexosaminidase subunit alpha isoform X1 [Esox lucius]
MEVKTSSNSVRFDKQRCSFIVLIMFFSLPAVNAVWPMPQLISSSTDRYPLSPRQFIFQYASGSSAKSGCSVIDSAFKRYFPLIFVDYLKAGGPRQHDNWFRLPLNEGVFTVLVDVRKADCEGYPDPDSSESYKLSVSSGQASLRAKTVWGALRGLESFSQLVYQDDFGQYFVNKTEIDDFPRFKFRGLLLDTSRHYLPLPAILKTLDAMSYNKFNVFHWHIVDDPSFPYQSSTFPGLSSKGAFHPSTHVYSQTDVSRVISHARLRGIRVLPEFDSPGHTQSWGKGQPGLLTSCYKGSVPSGTFGPVNPAMSSSYQFISRLFKEVASVFPDPYIHLGGDEVDFTCWKSNPEVRGFMQKMGFGTDYTKLESYYMENIINLTKTLNKTSIVWQDVFDNHEKIPEETVLHIWKGSPAQIQQELSDITLAGYRVILSAPWYINHIAYGQDWTTYYNVQPLNFTGSEQQKSLVIGGEVCMWGEYVDATNLSPRLWPRASAAAERLWSDEKTTSSVTDAFPRLTDFRCRLLRRGIQAEPLFVGHCRHEYEGI